MKVCLAKDPDDRLQTAHDVMQELKWIAEAGSAAGVPAPVAARRRSRERLAWILAGVLPILASLLTLLSVAKGKRRLSSRPRSRRACRSSLPTGAGSPSPPTRVLRRDRA